ncbi:hypothetical protein BH11PSE13_BH11PSE13_46050 [soil metagenome]
MPATPAVDRPALQGLRLAVPDLRAALAFAAQVLGLEKQAATHPGDGDPDEARFQLGASSWLAVRQRPPDAARIPSPATAAMLQTLHWRCTDLVRQRALLARLGFDSPADSEPDDAASIRVAAAETGACAIRWESAPLQPPAAHDTLPQLVALVLHARAPERAITLWAQMFQAPVERPTAGVPRLRLGALTVQFAFAEEQAGGVASLTLEVPDAAAARERAKAQGLALDGDAISLAGLRVRLTSAPPR